MDVGIGEKDDEVLVDLSIGFDVAEEADGVCGGLARFDVEVAEELDRVVVGAGQRRGGQHGGGKQEEAEEAYAHRFPLCAGVYAGSGVAVP